MTLTLFISLVTILSVISSALTEAAKNSFNVTKPTLLVAIISALTGWAGGAAAYCFMNIPFHNTANLICLVLLAPAIWLSATLGYDKVMEIFKQIGLQSKKFDEI